jgi:hypothetical protein
MYRRAVSICAAALLAVSPFLAAQDKPAPEKPAPEKPRASFAEGADLPGPFHPYNVANGQYEKKFHSLTNQYGLNPTVMIFAQNVNTADAKELAKLLQQLDAYIVDKPKTRLHAFAVFLYNDMADVVKDDDVREAHADELAKLKSAEPPLKQVVLSLDGAAALQKAGYTLKPEDQVTVVLYDKLKVTKKYDLKELTDAKVTEIMKEVKENLAPYKK